MARESFTELDWTEPGECLLNDAGPVIGAWLQSSGSMTEKLRSACDGRFCLSVLREEQTQLADDEIQLLGVIDSAARLREVSLRCDDEPCVFAQTLIPESTISTNPWLGQLGNQPLGEAMAGRDDIKRTACHVAQLSDRHPFFSRLSACDNQALAVWLRRSRFSVGSDPILVYEVFLPAIGELGLP